MLWAWMSTPMNFYGKSNDRWLGFGRQEIGRWLIDAGLNDRTVACAGEDWSAQSRYGDESVIISMFLALDTK